MKNIKTLIFSLMIVLFISTPLIGQGVFTLNAQKNILQNGILFQFTATVDSVETLTSNTFSLTKYDGDSFGTYPAMYGRLLTSVSGKPRITTNLEGSLDNVNWYTVVAVGVVTDSTETYGTGTLDIDAKKSVFYRLSITGTAGNREDTAVIYSLYLYRED